MKQKQTHKCREQACGCQGAGCIDLHEAVQLRESVLDWFTRVWEGNDLWLPGGGGMDWESGISRRKLLCIEWIKNKVLCIAQGTIFNIL